MDSADATRTTICRDFRPRGPGGRPTGRRATGVFIFVFIFIFGDLVSAGETSRRPKAFRPLRFDGFDDLAIVVVVNENRTPSNAAAVVGVVYLGAYAQQFSVRKLAARGE